MSIESSSVTRGSSCSGGRSADRSLVETDAATVAAVGRFLHQGQIYMSTMRFVIDRLGPSTFTGQMASCNNHCHFSNADYTLERLQL